ncbi:MAG: SurA N-terminal domain-containing protein [Myxococcota bacterium]
MLGALRRNKNSPIIMVLLGLVVLLMIGFGVSLNQGDSGDGVAARVNGEVITIGEFKSSYAAEYDRRQQYDGSYDLRRAEQDDLRREVLDRMITTLLLAQRAQALGLAIDDQTLAKDLLERPYFADESGRFSKEQYERVLSSLNMTSQQFEQGERNRMLAEKLQGGIQGIHVSEAELKQAFRLQNTKRNIEYVEVQKNAFEADIGTVTVADVDAWREAAEDAEAEVLALYKKNKDARYDVPKQACTQQVMVRMDDSTPPGLRTKKRAQLDAALEELRAGTDFGSVAAKYSEDVASKAQGGDMGCFPAGRGLPAIEEQAFSLEIGELSAAIKTGFGLHVIKVYERKDAIRRKLEDVRGEIERELAAESRVEGRSKELAARLLKAAAEAPDLATALEGLEAEVALQAQSTGPFPVNASYLPKLGSAADVATAAWALSAESPLAESPIETDKAWLAIRFIEELEPDMTDFEGKKAGLENMLETTKLGDIFDGWQAALRDAAQVEVNEQVLVYGS